ncbi:ATP-binding cassette transporter [Hypoxylon crocopeplum]|nr:ATP-binding cassette transporter [Hypoxylon crocopeplum]
MAKVGTNEIRPDASDLKASESRHSIVQDLAREYTSYTNNTAVSMDESKRKLLSVSNEPNSPLNPRSKAFNARTWAMRVAEERAQGFMRVGVCFQDLNVFGYGTPTDYQKDVGNVWLAIPGMLRRFFSTSAGASRIDILRQFDAVVNPGEMCVVLGPPGSGCSTLLKTIAGEMNGIYADDSSYFNYQGISAKEMHTAHRGDAIYTAEVDVHFPQLTVGDTLTFASHARYETELPQGITRTEFCKHYRDVVMALYGISHTLNTKVGDAYIQGVSEGERKRVTIAEVTLANAPLQCWDNSTCGLDSANAIEFCKTLRLQSELFGQTCFVSMYQAPQSAYDLFDKALVLYEGRQIYFGPASRAKEYFVSLGFECPARQSTPDFLTSMTFPRERVIRADCNPPRTPDEFAAAWKNSPEYKMLEVEIDEYKTQHPIGGPDAETFRQLKKTHQAKGQRVNSPYTLTYSQQVRLCIWRGFKRLRADPGRTIMTSVGSTIMALIISSLFYNLGPSTASFNGRGVVIFVAVLFNAFSTMLEIMTLYAQRPVVEKHTRYAFYHPSAEAYASVLVDFPLKVLNAISFNLVYYFMTNLNRQPGNFFFYLFVLFLVVMSMSGLFRAVASLTGTEQQAMVPASLLLLVLIIFTGYIVQINYMLSWCRWISYLNPVGYGYEALMINEFHGREFPCAVYVPDYANASLSNVACNALGAIPGQSIVSGDDHIIAQYSYYHSHKWRNVGIIIGMTIFNYLVYFIASEYVTARKSKGEVLIFRRGQAPPSYATKHSDDVEKTVSSPVPVVLEKSGGGYTSSSEEVFRGSTSTFHWNDVCYDVQVKGKPKRILDHVDGWVKPGTLTALMGISGAGKTTLMECLADRREGVGVITGEVFIDGKMRDESFQRKTGYVQQQDLHLETSTVREPADFISQALKFSALLRQPARTPKAEKLAYVEEVIKMLDMEEYANAIVGVLGEGLNIEQRKRLTIGVELVAKPPLLLFVDEPTSGLDSQTSWAIMDLLERLSKAGQSILCAIHQPSAMLFQRFDRLLLLAEGGRTVYFGEIGDNSKTVTDYFECNGAKPCSTGSNPAEWMFEAIGAASGSVTEVDWYETWRSSSEYQTVHDEIARLKALSTDPSSTDEKSDPASYREFAAPFWQQFLIVTQRVFQQSWRTPSYVYSKLCLCVATTLFIGLVFLNAPVTIQGLQNQVFAVFEVGSILPQLVDQQLPHFVTQRSLYEVRERPAKTYSWQIFMLSAIVGEIPWNTVASVVMWALIYFPIGFYKNAAAADQSTERGGLMWLLFWQLLLFTCTLAHLCISFTNTADEGGNIANFLFVLIFFFCGVLCTPVVMPRFWIFLYRVSPLSYWVEAVLSAGLANIDVTCANNELTPISPPDGQGCADYMADYMSRFGGYLVNPESNECRYCSIADSNVFLAAISTNYANRWRDYGIVWAYIIFNIAAAMGLYWLARMPKGKKRV